MTKKQNPNRGLLITSEVNKAILALIRDGDYQHPGEAEAIEIMFKSIAKNPNNLILDVGCGRGGTASYIFKNGWGRVVGIDVNPGVIDKANKNFGHFPVPEKMSLESLSNNPVFFDCDAAYVSEYLFEKFSKEPKFDVICFVSSLFLVEKQEEALTEVRKLSGPNATLIIFDYLDYGEYRKHDYLENNKSLMTNIYTRQLIEDLLQKTGWKISKTVNLDEENIRWYRDLAQRTENRKEDIVAQFGEEAFEIFKTRYGHLLEVFEKRIIGGTLIYASPV